MNEKAKSPNAFPILSIASALSAKPVAASIMSPPIPRAPKIPLKKGPKTVAIASAPFSRGPSTAPTLRKKFSIASKNPRTLSIIPISFGSPSFAILTTKSANVSKVPTKPGRKLSSPNCVTTLRRRVIVLFVINSTWAIASLKGSRNGLPRSTNKAPTRIIMPLI